MKKVFVPSCKDNHIGKAIWENFLPNALKARSFFLVTEPLIANTCSDSLQRDVDL
jgi:hypothetical protein